ncbi:hypothetical protein [Xylanivirga thermophila]|uniref:hypothetical protein n=1 Tax=Xylanivirga thermophila TaxID=2496273 RepID=UPI00101B9AA1|nr:hypothetical protein [Xylanivirga thermophila]
MSKISIKSAPSIEYGECVRIANGSIDLVVTVGTGPRIIRFGFTGGPNEFCSGVQNITPVEDDFWYIHGGHRFWHSPENMPRSYMPDNDPVQWEEISNGIRVVQKVEPWVQIQKEMEITMCPDSNKVRVMHRLTNKNAWPIELSAWGLSVMAPGGKEIIPQPNKDTGLLPNRVLSLWPYTKMNDPRVYWGDKYITLTHDPSMEAPFKIGLSNEHGFAAYFNHGNLFILRYKHQKDATYPDFGVSYETYTTDFMVEMETLSPLTKLPPDGKLEHLEEWELVGGVDMPDNDEDKIQEIASKFLI